MLWLLAELKSHPELVVFLTLALGYAVGRIRIGSFTLGSVTGVLFCGVLIGQLGVPVSNDLKATFFLLFLFSIGYKVGPQFFSSLKKEGLQQLALTVLFCFAALAVSLVVAVLFGFDPGTAAGLAAGALTESAAVGTAGDAIRLMNHDPARIADLTANVATAFAVAYLISVVGVAWLLGTLAPRLIGVDLAAECRSLEAQMSLSRDTDLLSARRVFELRAFEINDNFDGKTIAELETSIGDRLFVERICQSGTVADAAPDTVVRSGDIIALSGRREFLVRDLLGRMTEVENVELLDVPVDTVDVIVTSGDIVGKTLAELSASPKARGVFLRRIARLGNTLPLTPATVIQRGDALTLVGLQSHIASAISLIGYADRPTSVTNMSVVAAAIFLGALVGLPALHIGSLEIGLGTAVGTLVGGLVCGWLRAARRSFSGVPEAALWIFDSLGLNAFIAIVGLSAGPRFFGGLMDSGLSLLAAAFCVAFLPHLLTILVGRKLMHVHPGILLGICAGAGTSAPALAAIQETAQSRIPTLGYGVSYAVGSVLLTLWGTVVVYVMH